MLTRKPARLLSIASLAALFVISDAASGAFLSDNFDDGNRTSTTGGLDWYSINGTSGGNPRPGLSVIDDSAGIGAGNALSVDTIGSGDEMVGIFGQSIELGPNVGDSVIMSFQFRTEGAIAGGDLRFGIYEDSDSQLGTGGWGTSDGNFDAESPGASGDTGYFLRIPLAASGNSARINDEANVNNILGGSGDADFIASPASGTFPGINDNLAHTITFTAVRTGVGPSDIEATLSLDNASFGGIDGNDTINSATSFDYFVATTTSNTSWVIDEFVIQSIPEPSSVVLLLGGLLVMPRLRR